MKKTINKIVPNIFLFLITILLSSTMVGCATAPLYPAMPFAVHRAGATMVQEVKLDYDVYYAFDLLLYFNKDTADRVHKLAGSGRFREDETGKPIYFNDGVPIYLELKIIGLDEAVKGFYFEDKLFSGALESAGPDPHSPYVPNSGKGVFYRMIKTMRLKPGLYRITLKSLRDIPELEGTPVAFWLHWAHDARPFYE